MRDEFITQEENIIYKTYKPRAMKLDDVEYKYLQEQVKHIEFMLETGGCVLSNDQLTALKLAATKRLEKIVPPAKEAKEKEEDKGASRWDRFRRWRQGQRMQAMLDELRWLGGEEGIYSAHTHVFCMPLEAGAKKQYDIGEYEGELNGEKRHGKGELRYKPFAYFFSQRYDGAWVDDKIEGKGVMEYNDSIVYSGSWKNGVRDGAGEMQYNNGDTYTGCWANDMRVGQGLMVFKNKNEYEGAWKTDKMSDGTYTNKSEAWCFGGTFDGVYPKAGTLTYRDNEGTWGIHSQSWQKVSIHEQKPVYVDTKPPEKEKTSPPQAKSKMSEFFKKIHEGAVQIWDDWDVYLETRRDKNEPGFPAHTRYRH